MSDPVQPAFGLSRRECQVLDIGEFRRRDIAELLGISEHTVKAALRTAYLKLGAETRAQAVTIWRSRRAA